ncbi:MAG: carbon-nitrogen hydrolase family protein [Saprospiraceae bacterium]
MKIAIVQIDSCAGDIPKNIEKHLAFAKKAAEMDADLVVFPELSITGYEPTVAADLATEPSDPIFTPFQQFANEKEVIIVIGMPLKTAEKPQIGLGIFRPSSPPAAYAKMLLDPDELPYFSAGNQPMIIEHKNQRIALAICYESQQESHLCQLLELQPTAYLASVALPKRGVEKSHRHYAAMAAKYKIPILMSDNIGQHDVYDCGGCSGVWDQRGELKMALDGESEGGIIYDLETGNAKVI